MKIIYNFLKYYLFGFLFGYFAIDMWRLASGDMRPLRKKGIQVEWLVNTKQDKQEKDRFTFLGFRVTYTYSEPVILKPED